SRANNQGASSSRSPINSTNTMPGTHTQSAATPRQAAKAAPPTIPVPSEMPEATNASTTRTEVNKGFAGSPKAPIPVHIGVGVVRDASSQAYKFDEEEGEDENTEDYDDEEQARLSAKIKLDDLKTIRGTSAASTERLTVLNNVMGTQISEEQLQKIIQVAWG